VLFRSGKSDVIKVTLFGETIVLDSGDQFAGAA